MILAVDFYFIPLTEFLISSFGVPAEINTSWERKK